MEVAEGAPRPTLSVIIPALDEAAGIGETLQALQTWRAAGDEIVLVDGGSRDGTQALAAPLVDQLLQAPRGRALQMNAGALASRGRLLVFLHADTRPEPGARDDLLLRSEARTPLLWGRFDVRLSGRGPGFRLVEALMNLRSRLTGIATGDQGMFVSRELFLRVGGFPEQPLMEDIELSARLRRLSWPRCLRAKVRTSSRRWEQGGLLPTVLLMWRLRLAYWWHGDAQALTGRYREVRAGE